MQNDAKANKEENDRHTPMASKEKLESSGTASQVSVTSVKIGSRNLKVIEGAGNNAMVPSVVLSELTTKRVEATQSSPTLSQSTNSLRRQLKLPSSGHDLLRNPDCIRRRWKVDYPKEKGDELLIKERGSHGNPKKKEDV
ncbi:hypothetical protein HAX54_037707 [Datura stramonium]|uniref:Uncharacterized protein n=1 Tax=Datura stramonium TaxID=4076 RepID=A0ABS8VIP3_DATST|nr:hypothetical protein [Datura stramonium]